MSMLLILDSGGGQATVTHQDGLRIADNVSWLLTRHVTILDLIMVNTATTLRASRNVVDSLSVADRLTEAVTRQLLDHIRAADQPYTFPRLTIADLLKVQEIVTGRANYSQSVQDSMRVADSRATAARHATIADAIKAGDQASLRVDVRPTDRIKAADTINENVRLSLSDYIRLVDAAYSAMNVLTLVSDSMRVSDTPTRPGVGVSDRMAAADAASFMQHNTYIQYDYLRARDTALEAPAVSLLDAMRVTDTPGTTVRVSRSLLDLLRVSATATPLGGFYQTVTDSLRVTDEILERASITITDLLKIPDLQVNDDGIRDRIRIADVAKIAIAMTVVDVARVSDQPYMQPRISLPADGLGVLDTISRLDVRRQLVESVRISEASPTYRLGVLVTDYARVAEAVLRFATRIVQDNMRVTDPYSISVRRALTDQLRISDQAAVKVQHALADFIEVSDSMARHTNVTIIDRTRASDTTSPTVSAFMTLLDRLRAADTTQHALITGKLIVDTLGISDPGISRAVSIFIRDAMKVLEGVTPDTDGDTAVPPEVVTAQAVRQAVKFARFLNETFRVR